jgi:hypothetical protein
MDQAASMARRQCSKAPIGKEGPVCGEHVQVRVEVDERRISANLVSMSIFRSRTLRIYATPPARAG